MSVAAVTKSKQTFPVGTHWEIALRGVPRGAKVEVNVATPYGAHTTIAYPTADGKQHSAFYALDVVGNYAATVLVNGDPTELTFEATAEPADQPAPETSPLPA